MAKDKKKIAPQKPQSKSPEKKQVKVVFKKPDFSKIKKIKINKPDFKKMFANPKTRSVFKIVGLVLGIVVSFALIDLGVQYLNNGYSVAVVNGVRIPKSKWNRYLQQNYGEAAAAVLIDNEIILLEAKKEGITVSDEEIQAQIDNLISSLGGQEAYQEALDAYHLTETELKEIYKINLLTIDLISPSISYTDDDLKEFFNEYASEMFPTDTAALADGAKLDYDTYKDRVKDYYIRTQVSNTESTWLSGKEADYQIQDNSTTTPEYGLFQTTINIIKNLMGTSTTDSTSTSTN